MEYAKQKQLVSKLSDMTKAGRLDWEPSVIVDAFEVSLSDSTIRIYMALGEYGADHNVVIQILNGDGKVIEHFTDDDLANSEPVKDTKWFPQTLELFNAARRKAFKVEKALDEILTSLDGLKPL